MTKRPRAIVHLDLDAFYASVEVLDHRELADKPVVVGGRPEERGVVAAASDEARAYGVHSAMSMHRAMQLCPDLVIVPPRFDAYRRYSHRVMALLYQRTPLVEQISIDEAYVDLTDEVVVWRRSTLRAVYSSRCDKRSVSRRLSASQPTSSSPRSPPTATSQAA